MTPIDKISKISNVNFAKAMGFFQSGARNPGKVLDSEFNEGAESEEVKQKKRLGVIECDTCTSRKYVDGSDDPGVSFKTPTQLDPTEAATQVPAHEREHYNRESSKAKEEGREVLSNSIRIFTAVCSECGKTYVSGGETTTVTRGKDKNKGIEELLGINGKKDSPSSVSGIEKDIANKAFGFKLDVKG